MKSFFTTVSVAALVAAAAESNYSSSSSSSSTTSTSSASATPSIQVPSSISSGCSTFLTALNGASGIQSCVSPLLNALTSNSAISSICSTASSICSDTTIRAWLTEFKGNCTTELVTSPNKDVVALYDVLYIVKPFTNAVCAKDSSGKYCLSQLAGNSSAKGASGVANAGQTPLTSSDGSPDAEAFSNADILWLGANADMDKDTLCTECTKTVMTSYIQWESQMPPVNGIANSPLLSSQSSLWAGIQKTCPADFISGTLANAGASPDSANGALTSSPAKGAALLFALLVAGFMTL